MKEYEFQLPEGSLFYEELPGKGARITRFHGLSGKVVIPDEVPGEGSDLLPVTKIGKKAFLSKKYLRSVTVPETVSEVSDWAFAYCDSLREVSFLGRDVSFGRAVFMECPGLRSVSFGKESVSSQGADGSGALMAAAVTQMESSYLLDAREAGSREWLAKWDARMLAILNAADDDGYSKQILCGEEDYESADLEMYLSNSRKRKVRLLLLRLNFQEGLGQGMRETLRSYLVEHTKGRRSEETWQVIRDECGDRRELYQLFAEIGCLTRENAPAIISEIREEDPEMKAFFLQYQANHFENQDFFGDLEL